MKSLSKYLSLLAAIACIGSLTARAEDAPKTEPKPDAPKRERGGDKERPERPKLTDEEKTKIKAAREAAEKDPAVIAAKEAVEKAREAKDRKASQEARKTLGDAFKAAMIKADPSLAALLEKHPGLAGPMGGRGEGRPGREGGERGPKKGDKEAPPAKPESK